MLLQLWIDAVKAPYIRVGSWLHDLSKFSRFSLNWKTYKMVFKGALAPTIALAAMQAPSWALLWGNFGYLIALSSMLAPPMLPQAKFGRLLAMNIAYTLVSAALTLFGFWLVMQARSASTSMPDAGVSEQPRTHLAPYNPAASLTAAVWLSILTFAAGTLRDPDDPLLDYAACCWMIVSNFGMVYVPLLSNTAACLRLMQRLFGSMLAGLCLSASTSLIVFPSTCRGSFFESYEALAMEIQKALSSDTALVEGRTSDRRDLSFDSNSTERQISSQSLTQQDLELSIKQARITHDLSFARREVSFGRLNSEHLESMHASLTCIADTVRGIGSMLKDLGQHLVSERSGSLEETCSCRQGRSFRFAEEKSVLEALIAVNDAVRHSIEWCHSTARCRRDDEERDALHSRMAMRATLTRVAGRLRSWLQRQEDTREQEEAPGALANGIATLSEQTVLSLDLVDALEVTSSRGWPRLNFPRWRSFHAERAEDRERNSKAASSGSTGVHGSTNSDKLSAIAAKAERCLHRAWRSTSSAKACFAARMTVATTVSAALAFFAPTQYWYNANHISWAQYAVALAMKHSPKDCTRRFWHRLIGTMLAALSATAAWYACDQRPVVATVLYFLVLHIPMYVQVTSQDYGMLSSVWAFASTTILGYGVQVRTLGERYEEAIDALVQPVYLVAAIRMASIGAGLLVAWIFTMLPYPGSDDVDLHRNTERCGRQGEDVGRRAICPLTG